MKAPKEFKITKIETVVYTFYATAETAEEAIEKLKKQEWDGEIDYSDGFVDNEEYSAEIIE